MSTPTEPGYYWYRQMDEKAHKKPSPWEPVQLLSEQDGPGIIIGGTTFQVEEIPGEWGSRIPDPDETRELDEAVAHSIRNATDHTRNRLAEMFLIGLIANSSYDCLRDEAPNDYSKMAYDYADAMIAEGDNRNGN